MPDMNSKRFARRLRDAVENRENVDTPENRAEAASSAAHEQLWKRHALVESAIEAAKERPVPAVDLRQAVLAALQGAEDDNSGDSRTTGAEPTPADSRRTRPERRIGPAIAVACAALAAVLLLSLGGPNGEPAPERNGDQPVAQLPPAADGPAPEIGRLVDEASAAYAGLAEETRVAFVEMAMLVPTLSDAPAVGPMPAPMPPAETDEWLSVPVPVREGVDRTFDFLFESTDDSTET